MIATLQEVFENAFHRLSVQIVSYIPPLLVGLVILVLAFALARLVRWLLSRVFKGVTVDRFLRETGFSNFMPGSGARSIAPIVVEAVYWLILLLGLLAALNVFDTKLTTQIVEATVLLFPKLLGAGAILLAGFWLAQFLGRSMLVWASNEEIPRPRRLAATVRVIVVFVAVVVAADVLNFAERVFFAAFIVFAGGAALALGLAVGLGGRDAVHNWLRHQAKGEEEEKSIFHHL